MRKRRHHELTAIIYDKRGRILSMGQNSYVKTHPLQGRFAEEVGRPSAVFLHAEIHALTKLKDWSKAHKMVVTRFGKDGQPRLAKPCEICQKAILSAGIQHLEHT